LANIRDNSDGTSNRCYVTRKKITTKITRNAILSGTSNNKYANRPTFPSNSELRFSQHKNNNNDVLRINNRKLSILIHG